MAAPNRISILLLYCFLAAPAFARDGTISSNGFPGFHPEPKVPGEIHLSCTLQAAHRLDEADPVDGSIATFVSKETTLEYVKQEGKAHFDCLSGCENPVWRSGHSKGDPQSLILPSNAQGSETYFPSLYMRPIADKFVLQIQLYASLRTRAGTIIRQMETAVADPASREISAEAQVYERSQDLYLPDFELNKRAKASGQRQFEGQDASVELRCAPLAAGEISKTELARLKAKPARAGTISYEEFHSANNPFSHLEMKFSDLLEQARHVEPDHVRAELAEAGKLLPNLEIILRTKAVPKVQEAMQRQGDRLTVGQAFSIAGRALGYSEGLSPSAVIALSALPFVIAADPAR